ncbi:MAG: DUF4358 domain-containing protein [Eubacteriales bacterium]
MKVIIKKITTIFCVFFILIFASCSNTNNNNSPDNTDVNNTEVFKSDITAAEFAERFDSILLNGTKLTAVDDDYINGMLELNLNDVTEYVLKIQTSGTEVDQYGVFKTTSETTAEGLADSVQSYLEMLSDNWENFNYLPEEMPKIKAAEVKSAGLYVVFVIATEDEKTAVFDEFYAMLKN